MKHPAVGKTYEFGSGSFEILAPAVIEKNGSNNNSVAIKLQMAETALYLPEMPNMKVKKGCAVQG